MRIGVGIFSNSSPGVEHGTVDTAIGLQAAGVEVTLFAEPEIELPRRAAALRESVTRLQPLSRPLRRPRVRSAAFLATKLAWSRRWADALERRPVDIVHSFSPGSAALLPRTVPVVVQAWFHPARATLRDRLLGGATYGTGGVGAALPLPLRAPVAYGARVTYQVQVHASDRLGYNRAELILASTATAASWLAARGLRADCVPPALHLLPRPPIPSRCEALRVAFCADPLDRPWKGLRYLLDALPFVEARPLRVILVGSPSRQIAQGVERARAAGIEVELLGRVPRPRYLDHLAAEVDVLAAPYLVEEWGYSLFEALSLGVPVLAFDLYPYSELLDARFGRLVTPRDPVALAAAIDAAARGQLPTREAVHAATAARFGATVIGRQLIQHYERLLNGR